MVNKLSRSTSSELVEFFFQCCFRLCFVAYGRPLGLHVAESNDFSLPT